MKILFLDQNKWIDLARVENDKSTSQNVIKLYHTLIDCVQADKIIIPLTMTLIVETSKKNNFRQRQELARTQFKLSKGLVFRSRRSRIFYEAQIALRKAFKDTEASLPSKWFISENFVQAFDQFDDPIHPQNKITNITARDFNLYEFLISQDEAERHQGITEFSKYADKSVLSIENRRKMWEAASREMQNRAYSALLFNDHQDLFLAALTSLGHTFSELKELGNSALQALIYDVPTLNVERALVAKKESQDRVIKPNDLRDMYSFCAAIPYADWLIGENTFVSLAKQAKLGTTYGVQITSKLEDLSAFLDKYL